MAGEVQVFEKFSLFCRDTIGKIKYEIKDATAAMEDSRGRIVEGENCAREAGNAIEQFQASIDDSDSQMESATFQRKQEREQYDTDKKDYDETLFALQQAITILKKKDVTMAQAASLIQRISTLNRIPVDSQGALMNYFNDNVQVPSKEEPALVSKYEQPQAAAYESTLGPIINMCVEMQQKVQGESDEIVRGESEKLHAYEMFMQDANFEVDDNKKRLNEKTLLESRCKENAKQGEGDLTVSSNALDLSNGNKAELSANCETKSSEFKQRQKLRGEELEALQEAIDIVAGGVSSNQKKHLKGLRGAAFMQLGGQSQVDIVKRDNMFSLLATTGVKLNSLAINMLALKVKSSPFDKIMGMVRDMIERLQQEAAEEAEKKAWCDKELKDNKNLRDTKTADKEKLQATMDAHNSMIQKINNKLAEMAARVEELDKAMAEATEIRTEENNKNTETIADCKGSLEALKSATAVLKKFYGGAVGATALAQQMPAKGAGRDNRLQDRVSGDRVSIAATPTWDKPYKGQQDGNAGVLGMLETITSDFARLEADTTAAEEEAAAAFETFINDSRKEKEENLAEQADQRMALSREEFGLRQTTKEHKQVSETLDAANDYNKDLQQQCNNPGISYEERVQKREEEIAALENALKILNEQAE